MPELLSQDEIDALLAAVEEVAEPEPEAVRVSEEIEEVVPYDFSHPQRLNREQLRSLRNMHEVVVRNFGATLSAYLRGVVECRLISVDQLTYSEFVAGLPNPTCFCMIEARPSGGNIALELNPSIAFPLLDRLLGARTAAGPLDRPLTDIEFRLLGRVVELVVAQLQAIWRRAGDVELVPVSQESNPHLVAMAPPTEMVVAVVAEAHLGDHSGLLNVCIPFTPFQDFFGRFLSVAGYAFTHVDREQARHRLLRLLRSVPVDVKGVLARSRAKAQDIAALAPGHVLVTERHISQPGEMLVAGKPKVSVVEGHHRGRTALKVVALRRARTGESETADTEAAGSQVKASVSGGKGKADA